MKESLKCTACKKAMTVSLFIKVLKDQTPLCAKCYGEWLEYRDDSVRDLFKEWLIS